MKEKLANKFLREVKGQILLPPQHNSSIFVQAGGWNFESYFGKYFSDKTKFPVFVISKGKEGIMYYPFTKLINIGKEFFIKYWKDSSILDERIKMFKDFAKITNKIYDKLSYNYIKKTKFNDLLKDVKESFESTVKLNTFSAFSFYFDEKIYYSFIKNMDIKIRPDKQKIVWDLGVDPPISSFEKTRKLYTLKLILEKDKDIFEKCQYFGATYGYIKDLDEFTKELKEEYKEYFKNPEKARKELEEGNLQIKKFKNDFNNKVKDLNKEEKKMVYYLNKIVELRDIRKDLIAKMTLNYYKVAEKLMKKYDVPKELIYFYRFAELLKGEEYFKSKIEELKKRKKGYCCLLYYNGNVEESYDFDKNKEIMDAYYLSLIKDTNEIKGQPAFKGKVRGKAKIILNHDEFNKFEQGDILVTGMTRPEFVPLMKKASAIITNEGGITSHAAIVAREMKIPTIIGTKNATRILKDNDLVEVDAENGVVRILKRAK